MMLFAGMAMGQLKVFSDGNTLVGDNTGMTGAEAELQVVGIAQSEGNTVEATNASGTTLFNRTDGAAMVIGAGTQAGFTFDENFSFQIRSRSRGFILNRALSAGNLIMTGNGQSGHVAFGTIASAANRLRVNGTVLATGYNVPSDKKLKSNVEKFDRGLEEVLRLDPIIYNYNGKGGIDSEVKHIGIMAQNLNDQAPELVKSEDFYVVDPNTNEKVLEDTYMQINDTGIKYMLINAIKEQQAIIQELQDKVELLSSSITFDVEEGEDIDVVLSEDGFSKLGQNAPNPHDGFTKIDFEVSSTEEAYLNVFSENGKLIKSIKLNSKVGTVNLEMPELNSGTYYYNLIVDGEKFETKKMIFVK
jgi:hypothetical protein